jgi:succinyl-CoA synthetase alpha subunit
MGHAGAIFGGLTLAGKEIMRACGIHVVDSPAEIGKSKSLEII